MSNLANARENLKFDISVSVQKNSSSLYSNFISNLYIVYELNNWPHNHANNSALKIVYLVRNTTKSKFTYNGPGIVFGGELSWSFEKDFARNVVNPGVDNSSPCKFTLQW